MARDKAICALTSHPILKRYLKVRANGSFSIDKARIRAEEKLDGKYLISTNDTSLSSDEVALGYKQLLEVEAAFRSLKTTLELRPIYHRKEERIQSHVLLCWLALLLIRLTEVNLGNGWTWPRIRTVMDRLHLGTFLMKKNRVLQRTELTSEQRIILKKLKISPPSNVIKFENPSSKT
jgi:transposase